MQPSLRRKVVFMGSPAFAVPSLQALYDAGHDIVAVYTQPPRPAGRGQKLQPTPVHVLADTLGLTVFHPEKLRGEALEQVLALETDVFCVVAYGLLLPKALVDSRLCLNVHPSDLPRWRGAAPLQWTLIQGDPTTAICVMKLDEGMDTGPVVARAELEVPTDWNLEMLQETTSRQGAAMLATVVADLEGITLTPQAGEACHAAKITKEMRRIDWRKPAAEIHNLVRGIYPMAQAALGEEIFKVLRTETAASITARNGEAGSLLAVEDTGLVVACGEGALRIVLMQRAGGKSGTAREIAQGWPALQTGAKLS